MLSGFNSYLFRYGTNEKLKNCGSRCRAQRAIAFMGNTVRNWFQSFFSPSHSNRNALVLRTALAVRVHIIIEKLVHSDGRELRRCLFSLKQIFQDDKDLVDEFVQSDGLEVLMHIGADADQNYQNYILRGEARVKNFCAFSA